MIQISDVDEAQVLSTDRAATSTTDEGPPLAARDVARPMRHRKVVIVMMVEYLQMDQRSGSASSDARAKRSGSVANGLQLKLSPASGMIPSSPSRSGLWALSVPAWKGRMTTPGVKRGSRSTDTPTWRHRAACVPLIIPLAYHSGSRSLTTNQTITICANSRAPDRRPALLPLGSRHSVAHFV
jgi:hypothetical protein